MGSMPKADVQTQMWICESNLNVSVSQNPDNGVVISTGEKCHRCHVRELIRYGVGDGDNEYGVYGQCTSCRGLSEDLPPLSIVSVDWKPAREREQEEKTNVDSKPENARRGRPEKAEGIDGNGTDDSGGGGGGIICPKCGSDDYRKAGYTASAARSPRRRCRSCGKVWTLNPQPSGRNALYDHQHSSSSSPVSNVTGRSAHGIISIPDGAGTVVVSRQYTGEIEVKELPEGKKNIIPEKIIFDDELPCAGRVKISIINSVAVAVTMFGPSNSDGNSDQGESR